MTRSGPRISVVIPALGEHPTLGRVLAGYSRQTLAPAMFEVLVVADPAEADLHGMGNTVAATRAPARLLRGEIPGASGNRNRGWREARAPLVLFTDSDTVPVSDLLAEHLEWHRRHPEEEVAILGLVRWAPELKVTPFMRWLDLGLQFDYGSITGTEAPWTHAYTSNLSVKRSFMERVGGFDEQHLPYGYEDLDWGLRAREHGMRLLFNRRAVVDHWRTMTLEQWQARAPRLALSEWRFCQLHPGFPPWFHGLFAEAAAIPPGGRRSAALTRVVPRRAPGLGGLVWSRATLHWRQQIAPHFLSAWEALAAGQPPSLTPASAAAAERTGGAHPASPRRTSSSSYRGRS